MSAADVRGDNDTLTQGWWWRNEALWQHLHPSADQSVLASDVQHDFGNYSCTLDRYCVCNRSEQHVKMTVRGLLRYVDSPQASTMMASTSDVAGIAHKRCIMLIEYWLGWRCLEMCWRIEAGQQPVCMFAALAQLISSGAPIRDPLVVLFCRRVSAVAKSND
jgi:hypothetical protein